MLDYRCKGRKKHKTEQKVRPTLNKHDPKKKPRGAGLEIHCLEETW